MATVVYLQPGYYPDPTAGRPVSNADIYVGDPDTDPEVVGNQKQISVQEEDGDIVEVSQPMHTGSGGVPIYNGSPVTILVDGDYSLKVLDSLGAQVYYVPLSSSIADGEVTLPKLADGTPGNLISYAADGSPVAVATGDDGQVLTSNGAGLPPTMEDLESVGDLETKIIDYQVLVADKNSIISLGSSTTADRVFTLPSVGSDNDGLIINFSNYSNYKLTITTSDSDSVWTSGGGSGIETNQSGAYCSLRYDHDTTNWQPLQIGGGMWMVEGIKIWIPCTELTTSDIDSTTTEATATEVTKRHLALAKNGIALSALSDFHFASYNFNGVDEDIVIADSVDWDIGASSTNDVTIIIRPNHNLTGTTETYLSQVEGATDEWYIRKNSSDFLQFFFETSLGSSVELDPGTDALSADVQYTVIVCKKADAWGLYYGSGAMLSQIAFDNSWTIDPGFNGALEVGRRSGANYFDGLLNDVCILHSNIFNSDPVVGLSDTITIPTNFNFVIGGN